MVFAFFSSRIDFDLDSNDLAEVVSELLNAEHSHAFIFKGMENYKKVSQNSKFES